MGNSICLSHIIRQETPSYGNRDYVHIKYNSSIKNGETANTSSWIFSNNHIGTHMDSPYHFCEQGKKTYDIPVRDYFYEHVMVVDLPCTEAHLIGTDDFEQFNLNLKESQNVELILIRTGFEEYRNMDKYWNDNPGLSAELAGYFRECFPKLRCVGFDFISLTSWKFREEGRKSHRSFLCPDQGKREILVIEDMSLKNIDDPLKRVIVAPLFVEDGNGGAVTVFAEI